MATALSCVVLLGDAPNVVLGPLMSNFWENDDAKVAGLLNYEIDKCKSKSYPSEIRRAGHVTIFPLGQNFLFLVVCCFGVDCRFLGFQIHKGVSMDSYKGQHEGFRATLYVEFVPRELLDEAQNNPDFTSESNILGLTDEITAEKISTTRFMTLEQQRKKKEMERKAQKEKAKARALVKSQKPGSVLFCFFCFFFFFLVVTPQRVSTRSKKRPALSEGPCSFFFPFFSFYNLTKI